MFRLVTATLSFVLALSVFGARPSAQCPVPDHLDGGPCCTVTTPKIPPFPKFSQPALEICWRDCTVNAVINYRAVFTNIKVLISNGTPCDDRWVRLDLYDTTGVLQWSGQLRLQYSRTWMETDPGGFPLQVWRFLVNGDMRPAVATATIPCPVPPCVPLNNNQVRFTGYIDYAGSCALVPTMYQHAWMLTHVCDAVDHHVGFPRAGAFHPNLSYSFVGPAAGFVPTPFIPAEPPGGGGFEALRRRNLPPAGAIGPSCEFEERLVFGLNPLGQLCFCGAPGANQFQIANLNINGACGTSITTTGGPFLPGFLSMSIGTWTVAGIYPGVESVRWNAGDYLYIDPCTGVTRQEVFFGVTTNGGYPATQVLTVGPGLPLPPGFIDQSNSLAFPGGVATIMNVPYVSDHFIQLNF